MAPTRDYYADLELPRNADIQEIKKQFRKLALKYHPDRNPGREQEVNSQFQIIQAANEILSDPHQKAKYDATLARATTTTSRFTAASGTASGVRGNPWQNVGQQFPAPPRRNPPPQQHPPSGAKRWHDRFSYAVPPTAKQKASAEPSAKASAAHAFESMKGGGYQQTGSKTSQRQERHVPPPPVPPRTEAAKKRAEASFGTRKTGYYPHSGAGDEPPVTNHNYSTRINTERNVPIPDPLAQFRDRDEADDEDEEGDQDVPGVRQRTPYTSTGGERTNPFDGTPLNRAKASTESLRRDDSTEFNDKTYTRQKHSSSSAPESEVEHEARPSTETTNDDQVPPIPDFMRPRRKARMKTRSTSNSAPSDSTIRNPTANGQGPKQQPSTTSQTTSEKPANGADGPSIFNIPLNGDTFGTPSPEHNGVNRSGVDGIDTNFVNDDNATAWQFSAGSGDTEPHSPHRSQSGSRAASRSGRQSPGKRPSLHKVDVPSRPASSGSQPLAGFDANGWANKFGPQTFFPPTAPNTTAAASPARSSNRANSKKVRSAKPTVGNAAVVDDSNSDDDSLEWPGRKAQSKRATPESPQAMDIDPPQVSVEEPAAQTGPNIARNIPVEPSRPEWRSGDVGSITPEPEQTNPGKQKEARKPAPATMMGSEDTDEFRANLADLSAVPPLANPSSGLKSFADLKENLPFQSKASEDIPIEIPHAHPLLFPDPPVAPRPPPMIDGVRPSVVLWGNYLEEFESYLRLWDIFNSQVVDHFTTRKANINRARSERGYTFLGVRGGNGVLEYHSWIEQDNDVRRRWQAASEEHELRFREFMAFRERMK